MKRFVKPALLLGMLLLALPAFSAETVQITIDKNSPRIIGTGLTAETGARFLIQAEGAMRLIAGRPFMDGWFDPSGLGSLNRTDQVFSSSSFGILLGTWYSTLDAGLVLGDLATLSSQTAFEGNEFQLGLNMSESDQAAIDGRFLVHVTKYFDNEVDETTVTIDASSPSPLPTGIILESGDELLAISQGAARVIAFGPLVNGWFDGSGLGFLRRTGQPFPNRPYGSVQATFTSSLAEGFYVGDVMSRTPPANHYGDEVSVGLNMSDSDQASLEGFILVHLLRIKNPALSSVDGGVPGAGSIVAVQNFPNPFNPQTTIRFELNSAQTVQASVVDISGRVVRDLVNQDFAAGSHELQWDGRDAAGCGQASGTYFLRLQAGQAIESHKLTLVQ